MAGNDENKSKTNDVTVPPPSYSVAASYPPVEAEESLHAGKRVGKYLIRRMIGRGGMGSVYEAMDVPLQRKVALKILPREFSQNDEALQRFIREARLAAKLNHPNVVTVYDVGRKGTIYYIAMELVEGTSGQELLESGKTIDWREAARSITDICRALAAAHDAGLIHRDIKPGNLLWAQTGEVKLSDFGLAKPAQADDLSITRRDAFVGTPLFMSPEQCRNDAVDHRSDIYSLGATFYTLLTGKAPYNQGSAIQILFAHCSAPIPEVSELLPGAPSLATHIVQKAMAKNPPDRYQHVREMRADLEALLGGAGATQVMPDGLEALAAGAVLPEPPGAAYEPRMRGRKRRNYWLLGVVAAILVLGISVAIGLMSMQNASTPAAPLTTANDLLPARSAPVLSPAKPAAAIALPVAPPFAELKPSAIIPTTFPAAPTAAVDVSPTVPPVAEPTPDNTASAGPSVTLLAPQPLDLKSLVPDAPDAKPAGDRNDRPLPERRGDNTNRPPRDDDDEKTPGMTQAEVRDPLLRNYARAKRHALASLAEKESNEIELAARTMILWADSLKSGRNPLHRKFAEDARLLAERLQPGISKIQPRIHPGPGGPPLPPKEGEGPPGERGDDDRPGNANRPQPPEGQGNGPGGNGPRRPQGPRRSN